MVSEIRIYVEGGGDYGDTRARVREGFSRFLAELVTLARNKCLRWQVIACGSRQSTFDDFLNALRTHPQAFNVLLIDSEAPVHEIPWRHLQQRDCWVQPSNTTDEQCHFMAQATEAWLVADPDSLQQYYGQGFRRNALPGHSDVEQIDPAALMEALQQATRGTSKGAYHKIRHGPALLAQIDPDRVRAAARHCDRLFTTLTHLMTEG